MQSAFFMYDNDSTEYPAMDFIAAVPLELNQLGMIISKLCFYFQGIVYTSLFNFFFL